MYRQILREIQEPEPVDEGPRWVIGVLETGRTVYPGSHPFPLIPSVTMITLQWFVWKPRKWFGKLRYKQYKQGVWIKVPADDLESQGFIKDNFVRDAMAYIPSEAKVQVCYELDDVGAVIGWEKLRNKA